MILIPIGYAVVALAVWIFVVAQLVADGESNLTAGILSMAFGIGWPLVVILLLFGLVLSLPAAVVRRLTTGAWGGWEF